MKKTILITLCLLPAFYLFSQNVDESAIIEAYTNANKHYDRKEYIEAAEYYLKAAEGGNQFAQFRLGYMYRHGYGLKQDYKKAVEWYQKAAEQENANAQANLGYMYRYGYGVKQDLGKAIEWYLKAAEQNNAFAQTNLGYMYEFGYGIEKDFKTAAIWYRKAAEQGYANAQCNLGTLYEFGDGVTKDYKKAAEWYQKAANQGNSKGQNKIGEMYEAGKGVEKNLKTALFWYQKAAGQGDAFAIVNLGNMYEAGYGVEKDYEKAFEYFKLSAEKGIPEGMSKLGWCYLYGAGTQEDFSSAVKWLKKAVKEGNNRAYFHLGNCYFYGWDVKQDYNEAVLYFEKAVAESGKSVSGAYCKLGECYLLGVGVPQNYSQAVEMFKNAPDNSLANFYLALCHELGLGVKKDMKKSQEYMQKTEELGYPIIVETRGADSDEHREKTYTLKYNSGYSTQRITVTETTADNIQQRLLSTRLGTTDELVAHLPSLIAVKTDDSTMLALADLTTNLPAEGPVPRIFILSPTNNSVFKSSNVSLKYHIDAPEDAPLIDLIVKIDNQEQPKFRGISFGDEIALELPEKDCTVLLQAKNKYGLGEAVTLNLKWDSSGQRLIPPNLYVLAIGINDYEYMNKLNYAVKDMNDFADCVEKKKGYPYGEVVVKRLSDETARKQDIEEGLEWLKETASDKDFSFIYFAGHGLKDERERFHFVPIDGKKERMSSSCISSRLFVDDYLNVISGKVIVFTDACYSGALLGGRRSGDANSMAIREMMSANSDILFYSATSDNTVAQEIDNEQNGAFTKALLEALEGAGKKEGKSMLTTMDLQEYLRNRVRELSKNQFPNFHIKDDIPLFTYQEEEEGVKNDEGVKE